MAEVHVLKMNYRELPRSCHDIFYIFFVQFDLTSISPATITEARTTTSQKYSTSNVTSVIKQPNRYVHVCIVKIKHSSTMSNGGQDTNIPYSW